MPQGIIPDEGAPGTLLGMLGSSSAGLNTVTLLLWVNNFTPDSTVTLSSLTEASFGGWVRYALDPSLWITPTTAHGCTTTTWGTSPIQWTVSAAMGQTVYGFALWDRMANLLRWVQRLEPADIVPLTNGMVVSLLPTITLTSAACAGTISEEPRLEARPRGRRKDA